MPIEFFSPAIFYAIGAGVFAGGAAWGGSKSALNGTKKRVEHLESDNKDVRDRLARMEGKLDSLLERP